MVLAALGYDLSEADIRSRCGYDRLGMRLNQVAAGLFDLPVTVEYRTDWSLHDIEDAVRQSSFPIVGVDLRYVDGLFAFHAVVVVEMARDELSIHDPRYAQSPINIGRVAFEKAWESADRECLIMTPKPLA